jgi:hypothetical protein
MPCFHLLEVAMIQPLEWEVAVDGGTTVVNPAIILVEAVSMVVVDVVQTKVMVVPLYMVLAVVQGQHGLMSLILQMAGKVVRGGSMLMVEVEYLMILLLVRL